MMYFHALHFRLPRDRHVAAGLLLAVFGFAPLAMAAQSPAVAPNGAQPNDNTKSASKMPAWIRAANARATAARPQPEPSVFPNGNESALDSAFNTCAQLFFEQPDAQLCRHVDEFVSPQGIAIERGGKPVCHGYGPEEGVQGGARRGAIYGWHCIYGSTSRSCG